MNLLSKLSDNSEVIGVLQSVPNLFSDQPDSQDYARVKLALSLLENGLYSNNFLEAVNTTLPYLSRVFKEKKDRKPEQLRLSVGGYYCPLLFGAETNPNFWQTKKSEAFNLQEYGVVMLVYKFLLFAKMKESKPLNEVPVQLMQIQGILKEKFEAFLSSVSVANHVAGKNKLEAFVHNELDKLSKENGTGLLTEATRARSSRAFGDTAST